jgi:hypothetical protein
VNQRDSDPRVPYVITVIDALRNVPHDVLPCPHKAALIAIARHATPDGCNAWPGVQTIADICSKTKRQMFDILAELEQAGWLERRQRYYNKAQTSSEYIVCLDGGTVEKKRRGAVE